MLGATTDRVAPEVGDPPEHFASQRAWAQGRVAPSSAGLSKRRAGSSGGVATPKVSGRYLPAAHVCMARANTAVDVSNGIVSALRTSSAPVRPTPDMPLILGRQPL